MKTNTMKTTKLFIAPVRLAAGLLATFAAPSAFADNASWTGAANDGNLWSNPNNWSGPPAAVPGAGNTATFDAAAGPGGTVIDLGSGVTINKIIFAAGCDAYTIGAGAVNSQTLTLAEGWNQGFSATSGAFTSQITVNAAIIVKKSSQWYCTTGAQPWIINGDMTVDGTAGSTIGVQNNGRAFQFNGILSDQVGGAKLQMKGVNATTAFLTNPNNTFTGGLAFENGNVTVNSIGMIGSPSAAGSGGPLAFGSGFGSGTLTVTDAGDFTTDRVIDIVHGFKGPTITQSGASGTLKFLADLTVTHVSSPPLTLQGNTAGEGEFAGAIVDNGTTGTTLVKTGGLAKTTLDLMSVDGIEVGASVSADTGIDPGTTVTAINTGLKRITLSAATTANVAQNSTITVEGVVNITHVTKNGSGTWTLSGANTHSGVTQVINGTLVLTNALALQNSRLDTAGSTVGNASKGLKTDQTTLTLGGLTGNKDLASVFTTALGGPSGTTALGGYSDVTALTLNPGVGMTPSYSAIIADGAAGMTLIKTGDGTQVLDGTNAYTGTTTVSAGTLLVNSPGSLHASSAVSVTGGTLGGTGTIGGAVTVAAAGSVAPGASAGLLTVDSLDLVAMANGGSGKLKFELDTDTASSDRIAVTNTLTIDSGTPVLGFNDFQFSNLGGLAVGTYTLITATSISGDLDSGNLTGTIGSFTGTLQKTSTTIELVVTAASGYAAWQSANGTSGELNDDHDGDGVDNGTEFFIYGPVANSGFTALPGVTDTAGMLSVTWTKAAGYTGNYGPDYVVETSATLGAGSWTAEKADPEVGFTVTFPSATEVKYTFPAGTKNFARLKVTGP